VERTEIQSDLHYQDTETPNMLPKSVESSSPGLNKFFIQWMSAQWLKSQNERGTIFIDGVVTLLKIGHSTVGIRSNSHAAATSRHACMADALKARCVLADVRWRWT
jgi:hypothetical protein